MAESGPKWPKVAQTAKVAQSGPKWPKVTQSGPDPQRELGWPKVAQSGPKFRPPIIALKILKVHFFWDTLYVPKILVLSAMSSWVLGDNTMDNTGGCGSAAKRLIRRPR